MKRKEVLLSLVIGLALEACATGMVRPAPFRERPDSVQIGDLRGPFEGRVVDAETGRPIAGALVYGSWSWVSGFGLTAPSGWREYVGTTDISGRYAISRLDDLPRKRGERLASFQLVVYKKGYAAYRSDQRFDDFSTRTDFAQRKNVVKLDRWRSDLSHIRHLRYIGGGATLAALTTWELPEAAAELAGQKVSMTDASPAKLPVLAADKLLTGRDIKKLTGFEGDFETTELGDEPASPEYGSVHLRARGLPEAYDVALRVWIIAKEDAGNRYARLMEELPNARERSEIGDRSLRATSDAQDIFGIAFEDDNTVVFVTCGASQCRSHEVVLSIARLVKSRLETEFGPEPPKPEP